MSNGNELLYKVDCSRGAPMGRPTIKDNVEAKVRLFLVRMSACGAYDPGGAYWGCGRPLYACIGEGFQYFTRAISRKEAKATIQKNFPNLRFYR